MDIPGMDELKASVKELERLVAERRAAVAERARLSDDQREAADWRERNGF